MIRIRAGEIETVQERWLEDALDSHGAVVVEPWLDRVCDVSLRFKIDASGVARGRDLGVSLTDPRGQYRGGFVGSMSSTLSPELRRFMSGDGRDRQRMRRVMKTAADEVARALESSGYVGPVGVDALVYREVDGDLRLKPIVEVNPRTTMGHLCASLDKRIAKGRVGVWLILPLPALVRARFESIAAFGAHLRAEHPVRMNEGRIAAGALPTTDTSTARGFASVLFVAEGLAELAAMIPVPWLSEFVVR